MVIFGEKVKRRTVNNTIWLNSLQKEDIWKYQIYNLAHSAEDCGPWGDITPHDVTRNLVDHLSLRLAIVWQI